MHDEDEEDVMQKVNHAEDVAARWEKAIEEHKQRLALNGEGVREIRELTDTLRNMEASHQAMRFIANEVHRLNEVHNENLRIQNEMTESLADLNAAMVDIARRLLALEDFA